MKRNNRKLGLYSCLSGKALHVTWVSIFVLTILLGSNGAYGTPEARGWRSYGIHSKKIGARPDREHAPVPVPQHFSGRAEVGIADVPGAPEGGSINLSSNSAPSVVKVPGWEDVFPKTVSAAPLVPRPDLPQTDPNTYPTRTKPQLYNYALQEQFAPVNEQSGLFDDVDVCNGGLNHGNIDMELPAKGALLPVIRGYHSTNGWTNPVGSFGYNWDSNIDARVQKSGNTAYVYVNGANPVECNWTGSLWDCPPGLTLTGGLYGPYTYSNVNGVTYYFNAVNRISRQSLRTEQTFEWKYDVNGDVTGIQDVTGGASDNIYRFEQNDGLITAVMDVVSATNSATAYYYYDESNNLTRTLNARGGYVAQPDRHYIYDNDHKLLTITEMADSPLDAGSIADHYYYFTYDGSGRILTLTKVYGKPNHDPGTPTAEDKYAHTVYNYDGYGGGSYYQVNSFGTTRHSFWDADKNLTKLRISKDGNNYDYSYEYDSDDQLTRTSTPGGRIVDTPRTSTGRQEAYIIYDSSSPITLFDYEYGDFGNSTKVTSVASSSLTREVRYDYDTYGNVLTSTLEMGSGANDDFVAVYDYDADQNIITSTSRDGKVNVYEYDTDCFLTKAIMDNGGRSLTSEMGVDGVGRMTLLVDSKGMTWKDMYDSYGIITTIVTPDNMEILWHHYSWTFRPSPDAHVYFRSKSEEFDDENYNRNKYPYYFNYTAGDRWGNPIGLHPNCIVAPTIQEYLPSDLFAYDASDRLINFSYSAGMKEFNYTYYDELGGKLYKMDAYDSVSETTVTKDRLYYDADRNLISKTNALNKRTQYTLYDQYNRATRQTDALGDYIEVEYDKIGHVTRRIKRDSSNAALTEVRMEYDPAGRVTRKRMLVTPGGSTSNNDAVVDTVYDKADRILTRTTWLTDSDTKVEAYTYDNNGNMLTKTTTDGPTVAKVYDAKGNVISKIVDPGGLDLTTLYYYDDSDRVTRLTNPDGTYIQKQYDSSSNVKKEIRYDSSGITVAIEESAYNYEQRKTESYKYNDLTQTAHDSDDPYVLNEYIGPYLLTKETGNGDDDQFTYYEYDGFAHQTREKDSIGNERISFYDDADNVTKVQELDYSSGGYITRGIEYEYDDKNRVTKTIQCGSDGTLGTADDLASTVWYDGMNRKTLVEDSAGQKIATHYDGLGRMTRQIEDSDGIARYTDYLYNRAGWRTRHVAYTDGTTGAQNTDYAYNRVGVKTRVTYPDDDVSDRGYVSFTFDAALRMITKNDQENQNTIMDYDSMGRVITKTKGTEIDTFAYDALGQLTLAQRGVSGNLDSVSKTERFYNELGRVTRESQAIKETTSKHTDYAYDQAGNITALYYPSGNLTIEPTWTKLNQIDTISRDGVQIANYDYIGSRVEQLIYETGANDVTATRSYDGAAKLTRLKWDQVNNTLPDFSYAFDDAGNILTKKHEHRPSDPIEKYDVDGLYRLTNARYDFRTLTHGFTYDDVGNQLTFASNAATWDHLYNDANEMTKLLTGAPSYDKNGNVVVAPFVGPLISMVCDYDRQNQLTQVRTLFLPPDTWKIQARYTYDALGRRIEYVTYNNVTKRYYHAGQRVIEEYDAATPTRQRYYVWGNYIDELLLVNDDAGDDSDYVVCHDQLYSPHALLSKTDGSVVERYDYDAYGKPVVYTDDGGDSDWWDGDETSAAISAKGLPYLFSGREVDTFDSDGYSLLQYSRARYYSYNLRRWLQRDPAGYEDGMNLYEYVGSRPVIELDPNGEVILDVAVALVNRAFARVQSGAAAVGAGAVAMARRIGTALYVRAYETMNLINRMFYGDLTGGSAEGICFVAGTQVWTPTGAIPIEKLCVGDIVWSCDPEKNEMVRSTIKNVFKRTTKSLVLIELENATIIRATPEHPFWVPDKGWVRAKLLSVEDELLSFEKKRLRIISIKLVNKKVSVHNIGVSPQNTYFVSKAQVLVHNRCWEPPFRTTTSWTRIVNLLQKNHGISRELARARIHEIKAAMKLPANYNCIFDLTGNVYDQAGVLIGSLTAGGG